MYLHVLVLLHDLFRFGSLMLDLRMATNDEVSSTIIWTFTSPTFSALSKPGSMSTVASTSRSRTTRLFIDAIDLVLHLGESTTEVLFCFDDRWAHH